MSAVIGVGAPWHKRHLESKADEQHCNTGKQQRAVVAGVLASKRGADGGEVCAAGAAEHKGDAVQEEGRRETAEDEVFEARFPTLRAVAVACHEQIKREAENFEAKEQHDEVVGLRHHDAAKGASQDKRIHLGAVFVFALEVIVGDKHCKQRGYCNGERCEEREMIETECVANERGWRAVFAKVCPQHAGEHGCGAGRCGCNKTICTFAPLWCECANENEAECAGNEHQRG
jgi:hypothetical protein